jgi:hypothetical protein
MIKPRKKTANKAKPHVKAIPGIFDYKTMLYVGANMWQLSLVDIFIDHGYKIDVLEIFPKNCKELEKANKWDKTFNKIIQGDVREIDEIILDKKYDVVCWWHGPEHVEEWEVKPTLLQLENRTRHLALIGCPYGEYPQGEVGGNKNEIHRSILYDDFFIDLGYETRVFKTKYRARRKRKDEHIIAWKRMEA